MPEPITTKFMMLKAAEIIWGYAAKRILGEGLTLDLVDGSSEIAFERLGARLTTPNDRTLHDLAVSVAGIDANVANDEQISQMIADAETIIKPLNLEFILRCSMKSEIVARELIALATAKYNADYDYTTKRLVQLYVRRLVYLAAKTSAFPEKALRETLHRQNSATESLQSLTNVLKAVSEEIRSVSTRLDDLSSTAGQFTAAYCEAFRSAHDRMSLMGVNAPDEAKEHNLSIAYVKLRAKDANTEPLPVSDALPSHKSILITGSPGSGKTTLMKWLGVHAATGTHEGGLFSWNGRVPFLLQLRTKVSRTSDAVEIKLPKVGQFHLAVDMVHNPPSGWEERIIRDGRALILVDGIDEVPTSLRERTWNWLEQMIKECPDSVIVVSSRPRALYRSDGRIHPSIPMALTLLELEPLRLEDMELLVQQWHVSVAAEYNKRNDSVDRAQRLQTECPKLLEKLRYSKPLQNLAETPLLCALICAVHHARNGFLASTRVELYDEAVKILLKIRDDVRSIPSQSDYPNVTDRDRRKLLRRLAFWMLDRDFDEIDAATVDEQLSLWLDDLNLSFDASEVRKLLCERTGLLLYAADDMICFAHRTLQEFLAADYLEREGLIGPILDRSNDPNWWEAIQFFVSLCDKLRRENVLSALLKEGSHHAIVLASVCVEACEDIEADFAPIVASRLSQLVPPETDEDVGALVALDFRVVPIMYIDPKWSLERRFRSIRVLTTVGGELALDKLAKFANNANLDDAHMLLKNMPRAPDLGTFAERVMNPALIRSGAEIRINSRSDLELLPLCTSLRGLEIVPGMSFNASMLENLSDLRTLIANDTRITDPGALVMLKRLTKISISGAEVMSVDFIRQMPNLEEIDVSLCSVTLNSPSFELPQLQVFDGSNTALSQIVWLAGSEKLRYCDISMTGVYDIQVLASCVGLDHLDISYTAVKDISVVRHMRSLRWLDLSNTSVTDLHAIGVLPRLDTLWVNRSQIIDYLDAKDRNRLESVFSDDRIQWRRIRELQERLR
jgi:hypothetical protein